MQAQKQPQLEVIIKNQQETIKQQQAMIDALRQELQKYLKESDETWGIGGGKGRHE